MTLPERTKRINATNPARASRAFVRAFHSAERVRWVNAMPCVVCCRVPCQNAHVTGGGMGRRSGYANIVPLCALHHAEQHQVGMKTFAATHRVDLVAEAAKTEAMWQRHELRTGGNNGGF